MRLPVAQGAGKPAEVVENREGSRWTPATVRWLAACSAATILRASVQRCHDMLHCSSNKMRCVLCTNSPVWL
jgi:hypothetical protein